LLLLFLLFLLFLLLLLLFLLFLLVLVLVVVVVVLVLVLLLRLLLHALAVLRLHAGRQCATALLARLRCSTATCCLLQYGLVGTGGSALQC
jgi:hypothetical protein